MRSIGRIEGEAVGLLSFPLEKNKCYYGKIIILL